MTKELKSKIFESLGEASMCWSETPSGVFESTKATEVGEKLCKEIDQETLWIELKEGNPLPDYDEPALWLYEDGSVYVDSLDKDGNPWIFEGFKNPMTPDSPPIKCTHWHKLPDLPDIKINT